MQMSHYKLTIIIIIITDTKNKTKTIIPLSFLSVQTFLQVGVQYRVDFRYLNADVAEGRLQGSHHGLPGGVEGPMAQEGEIVLVVVPLMGCPEPLHGGEQFEGLSPLLLGLLLEVLKIESTNK